MKAVLIISFSFLCSLGCWSQNDTIKLSEPVILSAKPIQPKVETGIIKIDSSTISTYKTQSIAELLHDQSPVFIKSYGPGSIATLSFRGTSASHSKIVWNGIDISNPMLGQTDLSLIPVAFLDRVEIRPGSKSLQISDGAIGGAIALRSSLPIDDTLYANFNQSIGSFGMYSQNMSMGFITGPIKSRIQLFQLYSDNDFEFYNNAIGSPETQRQANASFRRIGAILDLDYQLGLKDTLKTSIWIQGNNRNIPNIMSYQGNNRFENQTDESLRSTLTWIRKTPNYRSEFVSGLNITELVYKNHLQTYDSEVQPLSHSTSTSSSYYNNYSYLRKLNKKLDFSFRGHLNYHEVSNLDDIEQTGYDATRFETGAFASLNQRWSTQLHTTALVKAQYVDAAIQPIIPSFSINWMTNNDIQFSAQLSRNFHLPTLNDLYWIPGGNPELLPETSNMAEIDFQQLLLSRNKTKIRQQIGVHFAEVNNWIQWQPGNFGYWEAQNIRNVQTRGCEHQLQIEHYVLKWKFNYTHHYTFTQSIDQDVMRQLIYTPVHQSKSFLSTSYNEKTVIHYSYTLVGNRNTELSEFQVLPSYGLHNISLMKMIDISKTHFEIRWSIRNILNSQYQTILWRAMPGRNFEFSLALSL